MINLIKPISASIALTLCMFLSSALAVESHQHNADANKHSQHGSDMEMSHQHGDMFLIKKTIDTFDVSFHVMAASKDMQHGGSHNFMVKVEKEGKALHDVIINSKVIDPKGKAASKPLMRMGDWYMAGYDLNAKGQYQLLILFKAVDGSKHKGGVYYPSK